MKGYLYDSAGTQTKLPELLSWDVCHGVGEPCDWFEVSFIYYASQLPKLRSARRFVGKNGNDTVFTGVVDECSISMDKNGTVVTVTGRGNAALLLDNELCAQEYEALSSAQMLTKFVNPFGISSVVSGEAKTLSGFTVHTGESAWSALRRFCRYAWNTIPYFTPDGTLILNARQGKTIEVNSAKTAAATVLTDEKYGVISDVTVRNRVTGTSYSVQNSNSDYAGLKSHREISVPKTTGAGAARYTAEYQIAESMRGRKTVKLTITKQFACFPGDVVTLTAEKLGISGSYGVLRSHCWGDSFSAGTIATLEV